MATKKAQPQYPVRIPLTNENPQYPVRVDLPPPGPAPSTAMAVGQALRRSTQTAPQNAVDALPIIGPAIHFARPALAAVPSAFSDFVKGLTGGGAAQAATPAPAPAKAAGYGPVEPVAAAMTAGRQADATPITPQQRLLAAVDTILSHPFTMRDLNTVANIRGDLTAPVKPQTARDQQYATVGAIADAQYKAELDAAQKLGTQAEQDAAIAKATDKYFSRQSSILGANPLNLSMANMVGDQSGD